MIPVRLLLLETVLKRISHTATRVLNLATSKSPHLYCLKFDSLSRLVIDTCTDSISDALLRTPSYSIILQIYRRIRTGSRPGCTPPSQILPATFFASKDSISPTETRSSTEYLLSNECGVWKTATLAPIMKGRIHRFSSCLIQLHCMDQRKALQ